MHPMVGAWIFLVGFALLPGTPALQCYRCKYDKKFTLDADTEGFYNTKSCNTATADWNPLHSTKMQVTCDKDEDDYCRVYIYTLHPGKPEEEIVVERTCVGGCVANTTGITETHGATTTTKKTYCCHGDLCNSVLTTMKTTTLAPVTQGTSMLSSCFFLIIIASATSVVRMFH